MKNIKTMLLILLTLIVVTGCKKDPKCPDGYLLENNKCAKEVERIEAQVKYVCDPDTRLEGDTCVREIILEPTEKTGCKDGLTEENSYCVGTLKEPATDGYKCNSDEELKGDKCIVYTVNNDALIKTEKCPDGYSLMEGSCWKGARPPISDNCDVYEHKYDGCKCDAPDVIGPDYFCYQYHQSTIYDYSCKSGTVLKNNKCYTETTKNATSTKVCNKGYTLNNNECVKTVKEKAGKIVSCENGYNLDGNQCKKVEATPAKVTYTCSENFNNVDKYCVRIEIVDPK